MNGPRLAFVLDCVLSDVGGASISTLRFAKRLEEAGWEIVYFTGTEPAAEGRGVPSGGSALPARLRGRSPRPLLDRRCIGAPVAGGTGRHGHIGGHGVRLGVARLGLGQQRQRIAVGRGMENSLTRLIRSSSRIG